MAEDLKGMDLAQFARRLLRFDAAALIRLRGTQAWAQLPWQVLVCVELPEAVSEDQVVSATDAGVGNAALIGAARRDAQWRVALPPAAARTVEILPASLVLNAAAAAAKTFRELYGKAGERVIRDTLLDHQVITGQSDVDGTPFAVSQRLVQAVVRMGFANAGPVEIRLTGPWTALSTQLGQAWYRSASALTVRPIVTNLSGR